MGRTQTKSADEVVAIDPAAAKSLLERAVKLNPYDAASWIQLGLLCEAANDLPQAEEALSRAANVDATFFAAGHGKLLFSPGECWPLLALAQKAAQVRDVSDVDFVVDA